MKDVSPARTAAVPFREAASLSRAFRKTKLPSGPPEPSVVQARNPSSPIRPRRGPRECRQTKRKRFWPRISDYWLEEGAFLCQAGVDLREDERVSREQGRGTPSPDGGEAVLKPVEGYCVGQLVFLGGINLALPCAALPRTVFPCLSPLPFFFPRAFSLN